MLKIAFAHTLWFLAPATVLFVVAAILAHTQRDLRELYYYLVLPIVPFFLSFLFLVFITNKGLNSVIAAICSVIVFIFLWFISFIFISPIFISSVGLGEGTFVVFLVSFLSLILFITRSIVFAADSHGLIGTVFSSVIILIFAIGYLNLLFG